MKSKIPAGLWVCLAALALAFAAVALWLSVAGAKAALGHLSDEAKALQAEAGAEAPEAGESAEGEESASGENRHSLGAAYRGAMEDAGDAWRQCGASLWDTLSGAGEARRHFSEGMRARRQGDGAASSEAFLQAADAASGENLDADVARHNALAAALGTGADVPDEALSGGGQSPDLGLQAALHYNRGAAWMERAKKASEAVAGDPAAGAAASAEVSGGTAEKELVAQAVDEYRQAVLLAPGEEKYQQNFELSAARLEELKRIEQQQQEQEQQQQEQEQQQEQQQEQNGDDEQEQDQNGAQEQQQGQQEQPQGDGGEDEGEQEQPAGAQGEEENGGEEKPQPAQEVSAEGMTPEEAARVLDAMRDRERQQRDAMQLRLGRTVPVEKDW